MPKDLVADHNAPKHQDLAIVNVEELKGVRFDSQAILRWVRQGREDRSRVRVDRAARRRD